MGNYPKALDYLQKALVNSEKVLGLAHSTTIATYYNLGLTFEGLCEYEKAINYYKKVLKVWEKVLGSDHPNTQSVKNSISNAKAKLGTESESKPWWKRLFC